MREDDLALEKIRGDLSPGLCQSDGLVLMERDVPRLFQDGDGPADAGFREAHVLADVDGMNDRLLERKPKNGLEIHLTGFL